MTARQRLMAKLGVDATQRLSPQRLLALANRRLAETKKKEELQALIDAYRQETESRATKRKSPEEAAPDPPESGADVLSRLLADYEKEKRARRDLEKLSDERLMTIFTEIAKLVARA